MGDVDQRGFDDQASAWLRGAEAAELLGVKRETLYAYTSRGLVRSVPDRSRGGRARLYARADLELLKARHDARAGHGPVAASALRWGEPVMETAISEIDPRGPRYRGHDAVGLCARGISFEAAAELLWTGALPRRPKAVVWPAPDSRPLALAPLVPPSPPAHPLSILALALPAMALRDPARFDAPPQAELPRARSLVLCLAECLALSRAGARPRPAPRTYSANADARRAAPLVRGPRGPSREAAKEPRTVAARVAASLGAPRDARAVRGIEVALVLSADHELNPSTFAARIAASAGADLYACVMAGLATLSGPKHGGACDRVEALVAEVKQPARAAAVIHERARRGDDVPGFGHRLYPDGDPRAEPLLALAKRLGGRRTEVRVAFALAEAMARAGREPPTVDLGLVALTAALELPPGSATALFAMGRTAGWIAHVLEQRAAGFLLRPRARYVGPRGDGAIE